MIHKASGSAVIQFYQMMIDKTVLIRYTTDFILRIFALFYRQKHNNQDVTSDRIVQSIQATLYAKINEYAKNIDSSENSVIEIRFDKDDMIPVVEHHSTNKQSDILLNVFFKKTGWDEINVFRHFFVRYLEYYLTKKNKNFFTDKLSINKAVTDLSYIVQELLQNANAYGIGNYDYELIVRHQSNHIVVSVSNFSDKENALMLSKIIDDIKKSDDLQDLILKYMLSQDKHLGIISSVFNYKIDDINYNYKDEVVTVSFSIKIY